MEHERARPIDLVDKLSIPFFVGTMLLEHRTLRRRSRQRSLELAGADAIGDGSPPDDRRGARAQRRDPLVPLGYERRDTWASLGMLAGNVAVGFVTAAVASRFHRVLHRHRVCDLGERAHALVPAILLWDLLYYWDHRWMHEVRLLWANHVSHHSSRRYNLSTALRQPWSGFLTLWVFAPMPLLGFRASTTMKAAQLDLLYQYWIHTEAIDRLPRPIEAVLNTPSHHRVHHGADRQYLDKNFGGILIVWDRLFGTFEPELRRPRYGLTTDIDTYHPVRIAYHEMGALARDVRRARGWRAKLRHVVGRPGWAPAAPSGSVPAE